MDLFVFLLINLAMSRPSTATNNTDVIISAVRPTRPHKDPSTPVPEPGPDWSVAKREWGMAWELHWVGLGIAFAFLAFNSLLAIIRFQDIKCFARRNLFYAINLLLVALGTTRSLYLWVDPYESGQNIVRCPLWIVRPLFGIAFPCLMSAFCLLHVAFLEVAKIQLGSPKLRDLRFIVSIILMHFGVVLVSDTTVAFEADRTEMLIVCQLFFIVWGLINSLAFIYSGSKVVIKAHTVRNRISSIKHSDNFKTDGNGNASPRPTNPSNGAEADLADRSLQVTQHLEVVDTVRSARKQRKIKRRTLKQGNVQSIKCNRRERAIHRVAGITLVTSLLSVLCCALQAYSLFGLYGFYSKVVTPKPWPWWAFQTSFRLVELFMGWTLSYSVLRSSASGKRGLTAWFSSLRQMTRRGSQVPQIHVIHVKDAPNREQNNKDANCHEIPLSPVASCAKEVAPIS